VLRFETIADHVAGPGMSHLSAETSALYLASKSNYQNIIDGTHLPGVSYPEALAENLSSKRTSHKIAEQGRRNRINLALKEIESLLPVAITNAANKRERKASAEEIENVDKDGPNIQGASKASTVEMAIVYIKSLQAELRVTQDKLENAEKKLAEGNSSAGSQTSE
jgi:Helix-loop-helix DNA-binding domain